MAAPRGSPRAVSRAPTGRLKPTTPTGSIKQTVPTGARAVVKASSGEGISEVNRISQTVVARAPTAPPPRVPAADRTVVYTPAHAIPQAPAPMPARREPSPEESEDATLRKRVGHDDPPRSPPGPERTLILGDAAGPARGESTLMLPDDAPPSPERTMLLPDDDARRGGTLQLPEGTLQLAGEAGGAARGWTLTRILIAINVACGLLILVGLLVLVFGGDQAPLSPEK